MNQRLIDGFRPMPTPTALKRQVVLNQPPLSVAKTSAIKQTTKSVWPERLKWGAVAITGLAAGLLLQVFPLGYLAVVIYGIIAIIKRLPSRLTFALALGSLLLAPLGIALGQAAIANGFSLIGFLLLTVGVVTLGFELLRKGGKTIS